MNKRSFKYIDESLYSILINKIKIEEEKIDYKDLDNFFITPKHFPKHSHFYKVKRVPRKFKKKWKYILTEKYTFLSLTEKLWYIQGLTNPNYNRFLIKKICERPN